MGSNEWRFFRQPLKRIPFNQRPRAHLMAGERWLLCCAGDWPPSSIWDPLAQTVDRIIGVDGGTDIALSLNLDVGLAVGDLDSIKDETVTRIPLLDQDCSDLSKALQFAVKEGASTVDVIGVEGGDIDHQLAAFAALIEAPAELDVRLHLAEHIALRCSGELQLILDAGTQLSLFAFTACPHVSISGVEFPIEDEPLAFSTRGLHNVALGGLVDIHSDGELVVLIGGR